MARIAAMYRYPVKGLSAEPLAAVRVEPGACLPHDRRFALARAGAAFDPEAPKWLPKSNFLMLMRDERLAALATAYDDASGRLRIRRGGEVVLDEDLRTPEGRAAVEAFFERFMEGQPAGRPRLVEAPGHAFTDSATKFLSVINLGTVREIERAVGRAVHPLRFRGNLYLEDLPAWAELDWVGEELVVAGSEVRLTVAKRIDRCAATNVDPETAARDMNIPAALRQRYGHIDCGVYMSVTRAGELRPEQELRPA